MRFKLCLSVFCFIFLRCDIYSQHFSVSVLKSNSIAYVGIDNPISCTVEGVSCKNVYLEPVNGSITKTSCGNFIYRPSKEDDTKLIIFKKINEKKIKVGDYYIRTRYLPPPVPSIGGLKGGEISKSFFKAQAGVGAGIDIPIGIDIHYPVTKFQMTIIRTDSIIFSSVAKGNTFSDKMKNFFEALQNDDEILIHSVEVILPDKKIVAVRPLEFIIKD